MGKVIIKSLITDAKGQKTMAESLPVVLPSDQSIEVTATVTGGATEAKQTEGNASLASIDTKVATAAKQDSGNASVASIDTKVGEVQASPTANTILDRLKALLTGIVLAAGTARIGKVGVRNAADADVNPATDETVALSVPGSHCALVSPSDAEDLASPTRGLCFATAGTLKVTTVGGETVTIPSGALAAGVIHPIRAARVWDTDTSAAGIVAWW